MLFVCLDILTEFHSAMGVEINLSIEDKLCWALSGRHAPSEGKHISPEDLCMYKFNDNDWRHQFEWHDGVLGSDSVFDGAIVALNFRNVFVTRYNIYNGPEIGNVPSK
jgi:hypothetical protein